MRESILLVVLLFSANLGICQTTISSDHWNYIQVDDSRQKWGDWEDPEWVRYLGLDMMDVNHDGYEDIVSGRYIYLNPGDEMMDSWSRVDVGFNVDGMIFTNVDGDDYADIIAEDLPDVYWLESDNLQGTAWKAMKIGEIPETGHVNGQGYLTADIVQGGKPEILLAAGNGIYMTEIPNKPVPSNWTFIRIVSTSSDEGFDTADIDGDGDLDIVAGDVSEKGVYQELGWYVNPGDVKADWIRNPIAETAHAIDRVETKDMNGDEIIDIVIAEERYPGEEPDANLYLFLGEKNGMSLSWTPQILVTQYSMNNLDVADIDEDGDLDIVTNEHKGTEHKTQLFLNDGDAKFETKTIDTGKECHLGTQLSDLDNDGDLDIVCHAWDNYEYLHVWRNDTISRSAQFEWTHLSSINGDLPNTAGGNQQTASLVADIDKDGNDEFFITDRTVSPSVIMYDYENGNWKKYAVDNEKLRIEAGSASTDIDGDGDLDIVFGGESQSNEIWWWENPYPDLSPLQPWKRYTIKKSGNTKHHDQMFGDFDGDGLGELVFWNQGGASLNLAEIPDDPKRVDEWDWEPIYTYSNDSEMEPLIGADRYPGWQTVNEHEGLDAADIDGDGLIDIIGGGRWFKYEDSQFTENIIDASYTFSRSLAGQFIEGGRPEVVLVVGDGIGAMYLYQWHEGEGNKQGTGTWIRQLLIPEVDNGHTIDAIDINGDGHLDIFSGEMRFGEGNPDAKLRFMLGDGEGNFTEMIVNEGIGVHEGKLGDLDGDGDMDIVAKPYSWETPRIDLYINESQ